MKGIFKVSVLALIMMAMLGTSVSANDTANFGVSETPPVQIQNEDGISTFGLNKPKTTINLKNQDISFGGKADISELFLDNFFTGASRIKIEVHNYHSSSNLKYKLYKEGSIFAERSYTLKPGGSQMHFLSVDKNAKYYIKFESKSHFGGSIQGLAF